MEDTFIPGDQLGNELGERIGWEQFDSLEEIVKNRKELKTCILEAIGKARLNEAPNRGNLRGSSFSIASESEKQRRKKEDKERRKNKGAIGNRLLPSIKVMFFIGTDLEWLLDAGWESLLATDASTKIWMFDDEMITTEGRKQIGALPVGTTRKSFLLRWIVESI